MAKRLSLDAKFPFCQAPPGSTTERNGPVPSSAWVVASLRGREPRLSRRRCLKTPSLLILAGAGFQLSLMIPESFLGLNRRSN